MTIKLTPANILTVIGMIIMGWAVACFLAGCSKVKLTRPDGISVEYTRLGNQTIEAFIMEADGSILMEKQKSENAELYEALNKLVDKIP
jgi:hypothetical protein